MTSFCRTRSKRHVARSLRFRTTSILCGVLFLIPLANVALAADTSAVADTVLSEAISRTQNLMVSMSAGCSGGRSGVPPVNWGGLQASGNSAVNAFNAAKLALAKGETSNALQQISSGVSALDGLVNGAHNNCSGGASGVDPVSYGNYLALRDTIKAKLEVLRELLK
jgi:hypothetical protein